MKTLLLRVQIEGADDWSTQELDESVSTTLDGNVLWTGAAQASPEIAHVRVLGEHPEAPPAGDPYDVGSYQKTLAELASALAVDPAEIDSAFIAWLNVGGYADPVLGDATNALCYALYKVTKLRSAFVAAENSRERWRDAAIALAKEMLRFDTEGSDPEVIALARAAADGRLPSRADAAE